jgi:hypothetical protein
MKKLISAIIKEYLNESKSYPFTLNVKEKNYDGFKYNIFYYFFKIEDIEYECAIYPNMFTLRNKYFDVAFAPKNGSTEDIIGKDLKFMNSVLKTVADCIIDFINKNDVVKKIRFQSHGVRELAYIRFFKTHPYFSKFEIDDSYEYSGFVEIRINKGVD